MSKFLAEIEGVISGIPASLTPKPPTQSPSAPKGKGTPTYQPKNIPSEQIQQESGGRQFGKNGLVLVGRRGDGTLPPFKQRAYGVGQIQIGTAQETAKKHGIPWDETKLLNDPNYNLQLSDLHKGDLLQYYKGDKTLATAAYHSGSGNVDRAIRKHGRENFAAGLGPDGRKYVSALTGEGPGNRRVPKTGDVKLVDIPASAFEGIVPSKTGEPRNGNNGFNMESEVKGDATRVNSAADMLSQVLTEVQTGIQKEQTTQQTILKDRVAKQDEVLQSQLDQARETGERLKPIFARRAAIDERRVEVQDMGFFERTFAGLFNRNYDPEYLDSLEGALEKQQQGVVEEFSQSQAVHDKINNILNSQWAGQSDISKLMTDSLVNQLQMSQTTLNVAQAQLQASTGEVQTNEQVIRSQLFLRDEALTQIVDGKTVNTLLAQAKANGGKVMVNGIPMTEADLITHGRNLEGQETERSLRAVALQNGMTQAADQSESRYLEYLTPTQRQALVKNNGVDPVTGVQYSMDKLMGFVQKDAQATQQVVSAAADVALGAGTTANQESFRNYYQVINRRAEGINGSGENPITKLAAPQWTILNQMQDQINTTPNGPAKDKLRAQYNETLQAFQGQVDKAVDELVKGKTRSPDGQLLLKSWVTGQKPTAEQAARGFIALNQGGAMPPGIDPNSAAGKSVAAMTRAMAGVYEKVGGKAKFDMLTSDGKPNAAELNRQLMSAVTSAATSSWVNGRANDFVDSVPAWAFADKHPAGKIRKGDLRSAMVNGDAAGLEQLAAKMQMTVPQAKQFLTGSGGTPAQVEQRREAKSNLRVLQTMQMMKFLDASPSADGGFRPSVALADFMQSDNFQGRVRAYDNSVSNAGFGEMMIQSISGNGQLSGSMAQYAQSFKQAVANNDRADQTQNVENARLYRNDPMRRTKAVLSAIPGLTPLEETTLLKAYDAEMPGGFSQFITGAADTMASVVGLPGVSGSNQANSANQRISDLLKNQKLQDPKAEAIRKKVAPHWDEYSAAVDRAMRSVE